MFERVDVQHPSWEHKAPFSIRPSHMDVAGRPPCVVWEVQKQETRFVSSKVDLFYGGLSLEQLAAQRRSCASHPNSVFGGVCRHQPIFGADGGAGSQNCVRVS